MAARKKVGRRKGSYSQAARVLRIVDYLRARRYGATVAEIAEEFEVSERQVRRDLAAIEEGGIVVERVDGKVVVASMRGNALPLTLSERFTLLAVRRVFDVLEGTQLYEDVHRIYDKVVASLPGSKQPDPDAFEDRFLYLAAGGTKSYRGKEDVLDALLTGIIRRWRVRYRYRSAKGRAREGVLEPYALVLYRQGLYVIGTVVDASTSDPTPKVYAAERFIDVDFIRQERFKVPADFDVHRFFDGAFGLHHGSGERIKVVVDFDEAVRPLLAARQWHESQKITAGADGKVRLQLEVSDLTEVTTWVLGWGHRAVVIEPPALREAVRKEVTDAARAYR